MNKPKQKETILSLEAAKQKTYEVVRKLTDMNIRYSLQFLPDARKIVITAVAGCDAAKIVVPEFSIETDSRGGRYAALILKYGVAQ